MAAKPEFQLLPSYLKAIENSVGSNLFRNQYYRINAKVVDILKDGDLSCAIYVTTILYIFGLIKKRHATVNGTVADILKSGWYEIKKPKKGALILWGFKKMDSGTQGKHCHIGFYLDKKTAISNSSLKRVIERHDPTSGKFKNGEAKRDILAYYWNKKLG